MIANIINLMKLKRMPAIACDIDGVVYRANKEVGNSKHALTRVLKRKDIPLVMLTNGGGILEEERADLVN